MADDAGGSAPKPGIFWGTVAELAGEVPLVGKALKFILLRGTGRGALVLLVLAWMFIVYPLLVPVIAAGLINSGALFGAQEPYASTVRSAFRVREATDAANRELNERLDYFHPIRLTIDPREMPTYDIPVLPRQRVIVRFGKPSLTSTNPDCPVPDDFLHEGAELVHVKAAGKILFVISNTGQNLPYPVTASHWDAIKGHIEGNRLVLKFEPVKELRKPCKGLKLKINATVEVFKDLLT